MKKYFLVGALLLAARGALAQNAAPSAVPNVDWPQFRGPNANPVGANARLADRWSKTQNVEWSQSIPGRGLSSAIVTGDRVFVTTVTTDGASKAPQKGTEYSNEYVAELMKQGLTEQQAMERVTARDFELPGEVTVHYFLYCLDLKTGKVTWKKEFHTGRPPGGRHRKNSFASESPVTDGKFVYVYVANLGVWAYDLAGNLVWKTPLEAFPIYLEFGTGSSPVVAGDRLVILADNEKQPYIAAFDKRTGKPVWRTNRDIGGKSGPKSSWATPFVWRHALRTEIVTIGPGDAVSYDLDGKELWRLSGMSPAPIPMPFAYNGLLYIDGGRGKPLFAVRPGASGDISLKRSEDSNAFVAWSQARGGTYLPSPVAYDGGIYALSDTGILSRFDSKTGALTYRERIHPTATAFTTSPWAYNGKLFCLSEDGQTYVIAAGATFKLLHINTLDEMTQSSPALVGERLLLRTDTRLYSIRRKG